MGLLIKALRKFMADETFRQVALRSLIGLLIKVFAAILSLLMFVAVARVTTAEDYGRFGFAFSLATLLAVLGGCGQRMFALRQSSIYFNSDDILRLQGVFVWGAGLTCFGCLLIATAIYTSGLIFPSLQMGELLLPTILLCTALALAEFMTHFLRGYRSVIFSLAPRDLIWRIGVIAVCMHAFYNSSTLSAVSITYTLASILAFITAVQLTLDPTTRSTLTTWRSPVVEIQSWWAVSSKLWLVSIVQTIGGPVLAPVLLGLILTPSETGPLFAALRIALALELFTMAAGIAIAPSIAQLSSLGDRNRLQKILTQSVASVTAPTLVVFMLVVWQGRNLLAYMNPDFVTAYAALVILTFGYVVSVCTGPVNQFLQLTGREGFLFKVLVLFNISSLALFVLLISYYGTLGAAIASTSLRVIVHLVLARHIRKVAGLDPSIFSLIGSRK